MTDDKTKSLISKIIGYAIDIGKLILLWLAANN